MNIFNFFCTLEYRNKNKILYGLDKFHFCFPLVCSWAAFKLPDTLVLLQLDILFWLRKTHALLKIIHTLQSFHSGYIFYNTVFLYISPSLPNNILILCFSSGIATYIDAIKFSPSMRKLSLWDSLQNQKGRINTWEYRKGATHSLSRSHHKIHFWGILYIREFYILYIIHIYKIYINI